MRSSSIVWAVLILLVVLGGGWYFYSQRAGTEAGEYGSPATDQTAQNNQSAASGDQTGANVGVNANVGVSTAPMQATVTYNGTSFSPSPVTIAKGGTVTFVNQSSGQMWVASAPHPVHTGYDGTTEQQHCAAGYTGSAPFDECGAGNSFSFTFDKIGSWPFHNHFNTGVSGTIIVQ